MKHVPAWFRWLLGVGVLGLVVWLVVLPQFDSEGAIDVVRRLDPARAVIGAGLVALAFVAQAQLTRRVLPEGERPPLLDMVRIELAGASVSHTVPGGTAAGTALGFRLLTQSGVTGSAAGFAVAVRGIGSALVLNVAVLAALLVWAPAIGFRDRYRVAAAIGVGAIALVAGAVVLAFRARSHLVDRIAAVVSVVPVVERERARAVANRLIGQLRELIADRRLAAEVAAWAALHWATEVASLWVILSALGWSGDPLAVFVAFGVVNILAVIPITPRGLGVVEG